MTTSPTFVATFSDDTVTRMSVYHDDDQKTLDLKRGVILANAAYTSRIKNEPPANISATFVSRGENGAGDVTLAEYGPNEIVEACRD